MYFFERSKNLFKSSEEIVSMFLGLAIVLVVVGLVFSFFQKRKGDISIPGISNNLDISQVDIKNKNDKETKVSENSNPSEYIVVRGDNLWKIAKVKYNNGDKWTELAKVNNLKNPRVLLVGQKLTIPTLNDNQVALKPTGQTIKQNDTSTSTVNASEYTIVRNDSLWKIAVRTYGDGYKWVKIRDANKTLVGNPGLIHVGNKIVLPDLKP